MGMPTKPRTQTSGLQQPPWSRVRRVQLIRREVREYLPAGTIELLLNAGELVVEGSPELAASGARRRVFATAMVTIDLREIRDMFRERADAATAERLAELLDGHAELPARLVDRVRAHVLRLGGLSADPPMEISMETEVRADGSLLLIDADVMGSPSRVEEG